MVQLRAYRVLLVVYGLIFRRGLRMMLEQFPEIQIVGEASDEAETIKLARELEPETIVIDMHALGTNVWRATSDIITELPNVNILIIATEEHASRNIYQAIRAGVRGYIFQDTDIDDLVKAICLVTKGQAVLDRNSLADLTDALRTVDLSDTEVYDHDERIERLTLRERQIFRLISRGKANREIAESLFVTEATVRSHIRNILDKLEVKNRVQAMALLLSSEQGVNDETRLPK